MCGLNIGNEGGLREVDGAVSELCFAAAKQAGIVGEEIPPAHTSIGDVEGVEIGLVDTGIISHPPQG